MTAAESRGNSRWAFLAQVFMVIVLWILGHEWAFPQVQALYRDWEAGRLLEAHWTAIVSEGGSLAGEEGAEVILVEFGDYQCPGCAFVERELQDLVHETSPSGRIVFRHFPNESVHPHARDAALAAICAEDREQFPAMHRHLFGKDFWPAEVDWSLEAERVGIADTAAFTECMRGREAQERLERDMSLARELRLQGTPSLLTSDEIVFGLPPGEWFSVVLK